MPKAALSDHIWLDLVLLILDSSPLWDMSNPRAVSGALEIQDWSRERLEMGDQFVIPEITDYEVRRALLRARKETSIKKLNDLGTNNIYLKLTTAVMREAASLWANARIAGHPTAQDVALDCDVILAAQALNLQATSSEAAVVVTSNVSHLSRYVEAKRWSDI